MTDAPVDLDGLGADLAAIAITLGMLCAEPEHRERLTRIGRAIAELRAARAPVAGLETAEVLADRIYWVCTDDNGHEFRSDDAVPLIEADRKAVALRVLTDIRDAANAALKGKGLSMSPAEAIASAWQAAFDKYQEKP